MTDIVQVKSTLEKEDKAAQKFPQSIKQHCLIPFILNFMQTIVNSKIKFSRNVQILIYSIVCLWYNHYYRKIWAIPIKIWGYMEQENRSILEECH